MGRTVYYNSRVRKKVLKKPDYSDIDFSNFRESEYPIPIEGGSVEVKLFETNAVSNASKAGDGILIAMEKQASRFRY